MINSLRKKGIIDESVLRAIGSVPREKFVSESQRERAYEDVALPIESRQTISQPYTVAYMTMMLQIIQGSKTLEIGTGSGYQAAILSELGADVYTVERIPELYTAASVLLRNLGYDIKYFLDDGSIGLADFAPFDRILVTAAAPRVPKQLLEQLAPGGILVVPIGKEDYQTMHIYKKTHTGEIEKDETDTFRFVPLIGQEGWPG